MHVSILGVLSAAIGSIKLIQPVMVLAMGPHRPQQLSQGPSQGLRVAPPSSSSAAAAAAEGPLQRGHMSWDLDRGA